MMDFRQPYDRPAFLDFLRRLLPDDFEPAYEENLPVGFQAKYIKSVSLLGKTGGSLNMKVYEATHTSEHDPRVSLSREIFRVMAGYGTERALVIFTSSSSGNYRFSLVTVDLSLEGSRVRKEYSNPRRYSFYLGPDAKVRTPDQFLVGKGQVRDYDDLHGRFSVEVVNKDFYNAIAKAFSKLVGGQRKIGSHLEEFKGFLKLPSRADVGSRGKEFAVRLIGRVIFCWFLKKKTSNNGKQLIPDELLSLAAVQSTKNFYHTVLEPLYFQVLNTPIDKRLEEYRTGVFSAIPFLNGGLFEPHVPDDYYEQMSPDTGLSRHNATLKIPDQWFLELFETLETYNFTIDENTTIDVDLSVDPEMLGRIFENLLAEINPETEESARKATGSYYTPRPIVDYMVTESLKQYLIGKTGIADEAIDDLLSYEIADTSLSVPDREKVLKAFDEIKIIDPACGSGAFPMGVLQKMVLALQKVDPDSKQWLESVLATVNDPTALAMMRNKLEHDRDLWDYIRKIGIIRKSIYGVDIQPVAVEIAKLRCFLSLVVEEKVIDEKENRNILPLPNLDFKFVCANALIDVLTDNDDSGSLIRDTFFVELEKHIQEYFSEWRPEEKKGLHRKIESLINQKVKEKENDINSITQGLIHKKTKFTKKEEKNQDKIIRELQHWESYKEIFAGKPVGFFNIRYFFPEVSKNGGFDIVIANPPYVRQENIKELKTAIADYYECYTGTADLFVYFYERGYKLLKNDGILTFISSNKYFRSGYGEKLRTFFGSRAELLQLIDFGDAPVFESIAYPSIAVIRKAKPQDGGMARVFTWDQADDVSQFERLLVEKSFEMPQKDLGPDGWRLESRGTLRLLEKLRKAGKPLGEYVEERFYRGIVTGFNDAFVVDRATRDRLIKEHKSSKEVLKPFLRGRDVKRWVVDYQDLWLLFIPWHFPLHKDETIQGASGKAEKVFKTNYPAVYNHLLAYKKELEGRNVEETGIRYEWYALQRCAASYWEEFEKTKIVWGNLALEPKFSFAAEGYYVNAPSCLIVSESKYLLGILNSMITKYVVSQSAAGRQGGYLEFKPMYIEKISIPDNTAKSNIPTLIDKIISAKRKNPNADVSALERDIDRLVYQLYGLTVEEIRIVEGGR